jgi:ferrous iron transport protein B
LSAYTPEEIYVRRHIIDETPDVIINVVDSSNLERNLYLTTQLIDMNVRMVVALNIYDELEASGNTLDYHLLSKLFGCRCCLLSVRKIVDGYLVSCCYQSV